MRGDVMMRTRTTVSRTIPAAIRGFARAAGTLESLGRDTRAAIGVPGILLTAAIVSATALPVANVTLKAERERMEQAAASAGIAATRTMREAGEGLDPGVLRSKADLYARLNLLDLPPDARRKALETLELTLETDGLHQRVKVDLAAKLPGKSIVQALMVAPGSEGKAMAMPRMTKGTSSIECVADRLELVFALDMTSSMLARMSEPGKAAREWPVRRDAALDAMELMVDNVKRLCSDIELAVGIVPWAHTVRVPAGANGRWERNGWIDTSRFPLRNADQTVAAQRWGGCLEDRLMDTSVKRVDSLGLSTAAPGDGAFPPYVHPDTARHTRRGQWGKQIARFARQMAAKGQEVPHLDEEDAAAVLEGDNDWNRGGGPNQGCIGAPMMPLNVLREQDDWFEDALAILRAAPLSSEGTMAHLGVSWGRRMLSPAWDSVWDAAATKRGAGGKGARQVLVLLSDGDNAIKPIDPPNTIPGQSRVCLAYHPATFALSFRMTGSWAAIECTTIETAVVTGYSALGRNGPGAVADGHRSDMAHVTGTGNAMRNVIPGAVADRGRTFLNELLTASCGAARKDGIHVYTVSLTSKDSAHQARSNAPLRSCAGTAKEPGASEHFFEATDRKTIEDAFRKIGEHVARIRRVS